jgi:hypothetical protein
MQYRNFLFFWQTFFHNMLQRRINKGPLHVDILLERPKLWLRPEAALHYP